MIRYEKLREEEESDAATGTRTAKAQGADVCCEPGGCDWTTAGNLQPLRLFLGQIYEVQSPVDC